MGTPEFAVEPLRRILQAGYNVVAVITAPDKPSGRGRKLKFSPVKEFALQNGIELLQPVNLKDNTFIDILRSYKANLQIVIAFRMLPKEVWELPEYGTINLHASILPQYRGAAPINHAIINGETETGLTTFYINGEIDKGNIIMSCKHPILPFDNAGTLHHKLMLSGGEIVLETLNQIENGKVKEHSQEMITFDSSGLKFAPKIFPKDCLINWNSTCERIHNLVRGLSPSPGAFSNLIINKEVTKKIKIFKTSYVLGHTEEIPGSIITDNLKQFSVIVANGRILIEELQIEGKNRLSTSEFLKGMHLPNNCHFE